MRKAASSSVSQDIEDLKPAILDYAREALNLDFFDPPIDSTGDKQNVRGFHHPQLAELLVTPLKLPDYCLDPDKYESFNASFLSDVSLRFCQQVREGEIVINHRQFPCTFYHDYGEQASTHPLRVTDGLLGSKLLQRVMIFYPLNYIADHPLCRFSSLSFSDLRPQRGGSTRNIISSPRRSARLITTISST
jgi:hypothetical protein